MFFLCVVAIITVVGVCYHLWKQADSRKDLVDANSRSYFKGIRLFKVSHHSGTTDGTSLEGWQEREDVRYYRISLELALPEIEAPRRFGVSLRMVRPDGVEHCTLTSSQSDNGEHNMIVNLYFEAAQVLSVKGTWTIEVVLADTGDVLKRYRLRINKQLAATPVSSSPLVHQETSFLLQEGEDRESAAVLYQAIKRAQALFTFTRAKNTQGKFSHPTLECRAIHIDSGFVGPLENLHLYDRGTEFTGTVDCGGLLARSGEWTIEVFQDGTRIHTEPVLVLSRNDVSAGIQFRHPHLFVTDVHGELAPLKTPVYASEVQGIGVACSAQIQYPSKLLQYDLDFTIFHGTKKFAHHAKRVWFQDVKQGVQTETVPLPEIAEGDSEADISIELRLDDRVIVRETFVLYRQSPRHEQFRAEMLKFENSGAKQLPSPKPKNNSNNAINASKKVTNSSKKAMRRQPIDSGKTGKGSSR